MGRFQSQLKLRYAYHDEMVHAPYPSLTRASSPSCQVLTNFEMKTRHCGGIVTQAKEHYRTTYAAEIELNETFNKFVFNYRLAYQGPNTARAQIGSKHDTGED